MRKIFVDKILEDKVSKFSDNLFNSRDFQKPIDKLKLLKKGKKFSSIAESKYIDKIINEYKDILKANPNKINDLCNEFDLIIKPEKIKPDFWKAIVECLRYEDLRNHEYLEFANELQYKTCFYCNTQLCVIIPVEYYKIKKLKGQIKSRKATFELDHIKAKSNYPFLATSFFNLIPSCSICNKAKTNNDIGFTFFEEDPNKLELIEFKLLKKSEQIYWKTNSKSDLELDYNLIGYNKDDYNNTFKIKEIYDTQKDIIEELIYLKKIYSPSYKKQLTNILKSEKLFPDEALIDRLIIGNYSKPEECHKRPFSKFTQDIARQLKLIKK
ncbi:MAG: HNH endonuclease [Flavobacterium nitrogenifigens]|uniref:HNH endonuclease n=1 Tax=Flavobacterium nitrogenifigens TaxID=1617283 RepID=UPI00280676C3|nr:HNH endonuclease [Flavobacterium nitrogenifigens]MDQ8014511.1 HNH endonuclease [Flavobacterium nitrogenifigens]